MEMIFKTGTKTKNHFFHSFHVQKPYSKTAGRTNLVICGILFFILVSFVAIIVEENNYQNEINRENLFSKLRERSRQKMESINRAGAPRLQVLNQLLDFQNLVSENIMRGRGESSFQDIQDVFSRRFQKKLPRNDWFLVECNGFQTRIVAQKIGNMGIQEDLAGHLGELYYAQASASALVETVQARLCRVLKFPILVRSLFDPSLSQRLQSYVYGGGAFGSYYGEIDHLGKKYLLLFFVDLTDISPSYGFDVITKSWIETNSGVVFAGKYKDELLFSELIKRKQRLRDFIIDRYRKGFRFLQEERFENFVFFPETIPSPSGHWSLIVFDLSGFENPIGVSNNTIVCLSTSFVFVFMFFAVEKLLFNRGFNMNLRTALLLTFVAVTALPGAGVYILSLRAAEEFSRKSLQEVSRQLHLDLICLDEGIQFYHGNFVQRIEKNCRSPKTSARLYMEETDPAVATPGQMIQEIAENLKLGSQTTSNDILSNLMSVVGRDEFFQSWTPTGVNSGDEKTQQMMNIFGPMGRINLNNLNPDSDPEFGDDTKLKNRKVLDAIVLDSLFEAVLGMATAEMFLRILFYPDEVQGFKSLSGRGYYCQIPLIFNDIARYVIFVFWDQSLLDRPYLREKLLKNDPRLEGIFASAMNLRMGKELFPKQISSFPLLIDLIERSRVAKGPNRLTIPDEHLVLEAMPAFHANQFLLAGQKDATPLFKKSERRIFLLKLGVLAEMILALCAAILGAGFFLKPLGELIGGLAEVDRGGYQTRLDASRPDEFGSLALAFNQMAEKLREGELLGKYVPSAVLRALTDEEFKKTATEGESLEVTVLFSGFVGFEHFQKITDPQGLLNVLEQHFNIAQAAVEEFGGEIDKVIGEKILIVFPHKELGGGAKAAELACSVISNISERLEAEGCPLEVAAGINTGNVIAGFFGGTNLRQEYTFIGDTVNVAARLLGVAPTLGGSRIVVSRTTQDYLKDKFSLKKLPLVQVKGKSQKVETYLLERS